MNSKGVLTKGGKSGWIQECGRSQPGLRLSRSPDKRTKGTSALVFVQERICQGLALGWALHFKRVKVSVPGNLAFSPEGL